MRILRYWKSIQLEPWTTYTMFDTVERHESAYQTKHFDKIVAAVKEAGFDYTIVDQPEAVLIERSQ